MNEKARTSIAVTSNDPLMYDVATQNPEGRLSIRTPHGYVSFYPEGDELMARTTEKNAEYFSGIEGYEVEGYQSKRRSVAVVEDWMAKGEQEAMERRTVKVEQPQQATNQLEFIMQLLGGPEKVAALLTQTLQAQAPQLAQAVEQKQAEEVAAQEAKRQEVVDSLGWSYGKVKNFVDKETAVELLTEYDPTFDISGVHPNALISRVGKVANENANLAHRLEELQSAK